MIGAFQVIDGFATKLPRLKDVIIFKPGLNILFGQNGVGKSVTLKIVAAYCSIAKSGWSRFHRAGVLRKSDTFPKSDLTTLPENFHLIAPGKCQAKLEWDGTPTLLSDPTVTDRTMWEAFYDNADSPDGMTSTKEQIDTMFSKPSAGQLRMHQLVKYIKSLKNPPDLTKVPENLKWQNDQWQEGYLAVVRYINSLPRTGPVTFLMDEPDRSLSIENQAEFWSKFVPMIIDGGYQVVIATHSVFAFTAKNANWIEYDPGAVDRAREALKVLN